MFHFFIIKRRHVALACALLASAAIFAAVNAPAAVTTAAATRQLPIYCVERDQKVCSISFDAAWGDGRVRCSRGFAARAPRRWNAASGGCGYTRGGLPAECACVRPFSACLPGYAHSNA